MIKKITICFVFIFGFITSQAQSTFTGKPMYNIDIKRGGVFLGSIQIELFPNIAPLHVRNFDSLVSVQFYDTTAFHRVIPGFMIQGGDPNSRHGNVNTWGQGQPNQPTVNAEFTAARHVRGALSAARANDPNSATSQFFICVANYPSLNGNYSVYGRVIAGMNIADSVVLAPRNSNDRPNVKHEMYITAIGSNDTVPNIPVLNSPANATTEINPAAALLLKWNPVQGGMIYTVEVAKDSVFTDIVNTFNTGNVSGYLTSGLVMNTRYFWRVKVNNGGHTSNWSPVWSFKTVIDAVGIKEADSHEIQVSVFPNPSQGIFEFSNLEPGSKIQVFTIDGKKIYETRVAGSTQTINMLGKTKGIYSYVIHTHKNKIQGKLVIE